MRFDACSVHNLADLFKGSGHSLGSSSAGVAAFVPTAAVDAPQVDSSQPTTQVHACARAHCLDLSVSEKPLPPPPSDCRNFVRWQARAADAESKLHRCVLTRRMRMRMYSATRAFIVPFPPESPPQLATSMLTFQNSPRVYPSRFLAAFRPRSSVITTPRWCRLGCSTLWCGRRRAEEELGARAGAASIADRPQRRWFRGGLQQGYKRKKCVQMLLLSSRVCFAQLKLE